MKWMQERDALIAQTMAFVQSVTGRKEHLRDAVDPSLTSPSNSQLATLAAVEYALEALPPAPKALRPPPPQTLPHEIRGPAKVSVEVAAEVRNRIEGFRQHQERFRREREEYFSRTLAKVRATLGEMPPPRPEK